MIRRTAVTAAALLGCLATASPALAAGGSHHGAAPLSTHLTYRMKSWSFEGTAMSMSAPKGWSFTEMAGGDARFDAPGRPDMVAMKYRGDGRLKPQLAKEEKALRGTPGLKILVAHGSGRGEGAIGELRYRWTEDGQRRFVDYRYLGNDAYEVAGRFVDRTGLLNVVETAADTGDCD